MTSTGSTLWMPVIGEHVAAKAPGLFNDLLTKHSIVGDFPILMVLRDFGPEV